MKDLPPVICHFRGGLLSATFYKNHRKWPKLAIYYAKWTKICNLSHFMWFLRKVEGSGPPQWPTPCNLPF